LWVAQWGAMKSSMALVRTTVGSREAADALARHLVNAGLAACVHVQEVRSVYRWQGKVEEQPEWLVEARALDSRAVAVREAMLADHPYRLPLVEMLTATGISKEYLDWARST
jgi:periplasmic divalent cation tolerance protein